MSERSFGRAVLRGASIILVVTVIARLAGFARYLVFGASVGAGDVGTAYATANLLPNVLFEVVAGGALAAVAVPLIAGLVPEGRPAASTDETAAEATVETADGTAAGTADEDGRRRADRIVSVLLTWTLLGTTLLAAVVIAFAAPLAALLLGTADGTAGVHVGTVLLRIFAVQLPLYGIAVVLGAYLQARKRFLWPAAMPLISSLVVMLAYRVYAWMVPSVATASTIGEGALAWLGWGTTAGVAAMALPVVIASLRSGLRLRPALRMTGGDGRRALALGGAGIGAVGAQQLVLALIMVLAMRAGGTGTLPVFQYAQALYLLPYAVLVVPLVTSVFPHLAEMRLVGDHGAFARAVSGSARIVMAVAAIGAAALFAAGPALEQFFRLIDRAGAAGVGSTAAALALGLPGFAVATHCTRVLSAALRALDALLVGSIGWVIAGVLLALAVLTSPGRSAAEASTAFGLSIAVGMAIAALVGLSRIWEILEHAGDLARVRRTIVLTPLAVLIGGVPGLLLARRLVTTESGETVAVFVGIAAGVLGALLAAGVMLAADPSLLHTLRDRNRGRRARTRESGNDAVDPGLGAPAPPAEEAR
ncbi:lipid II flippase MurJ [Brachybacterium sp. J144]|uniref:lipid II flippase MurJ n=1 Tax=Brachybacterium sp. J144 TaxID=3116487 RepID=UPI002E777F6B|nr:lipid II flippase MurJ [Brachybacterium sp. J144]MEE1651364.1 lipid II flippase MurJ [Brachybacterium sp. J144]